MTIQIVDKVVSAYKRWSHFVLLFQEIQQELQKPSKSAGKRGIPSHYPGQFFQVYTCECKRGFHFHPSFTNHIRVSESMVFFGAAEDSLNRFFPLVIQSFHPECVSDIFSNFHIGFPYVASYYFYTVFAFCTLTKIWT